MQLLPLILDRFKKQSLLGCSLIMLFMTTLQRLTEPLVFFYYRISQTFLLVPNFHWIVIEDSETKTPLVTNLLAQSGLSYTHLNAETPKEWKLLLNASWNIFRFQIYIFLHRRVLPSMLQIFWLVGPSMEETPRSEATKRGAPMASKSCRSSETRRCLLCRRR